MKQMQTTVKTINGTTFYITPFPAFTAARISGELSSVLAPMLGGLAPMLNEANVQGGEIDIANVEVDAVLPAISNALAQLDGDKFEHLAKQLLVEYRNISFETSNGDAERLTMDTANEIFCADLFGMIKLGFEVVKINFGGFFESLNPQSGNRQGLMGQLATAKKPGTKSGVSST